MIQDGKIYDLIRVHTTARASSILTVLKPLRNPIEIAYRIENQTSSHILYYRQHGVDGLSWNRLGPGTSTIFIWPEPLHHHQV